ncbi:MAG: hypothetical protein ACRDE2_03405, partial [Chitinophagaceae bacterium]
NKAFRIIEEAKLYPRLVDYDIFCADPSHARKILEVGLEEKGVQSVDRTQKLKDIGNPLIHFTEKAAPYLLPTSEEDRISKIQKVKLADEILDKITGIKTTHNGKSAVVEYTTICENISPFAVLLKRDLHQPQKNKIYMSLYDDGWRIEKKPGFEFLEIEK